MNRAEIRTLVLRSIGIVMGTTVSSTISEDTKIIADLNVESIQFVDIIFEVEKAIQTELDMNLLAIHISQVSKSHFSQITVSDLIDFVVMTLKK